MNGYDAWKLATPPDYDEPEEYEPEWADGDERAEVEAAEREQE